MKIDEFDRLILILCVNVNLDEYSDSLFLFLLVLFSVFSCLVGNLQPLLI